MNNSQNSHYLDYLGTQKSLTWKNKLLNFLNTKSDITLLKLIKRGINLFLYIPRKIIRYRRKKSFASFYKKHQVDVEILLQIVEDDVSREIIKTQINFFNNYDNSGEKEFLRKHNLLEKHKQLVDKNEYFPEGIINLSNQEVFVDCGAFTGDTIEDIIKRTGGVFSHIFAFEADKDNYLILETTLKKLNLSQDLITCYQKGVYSKNGKCNFSLKGIGSSIAESGGETIDVVKLDDFLTEEQKAKITFVKMDIEGSEPDALMGMQEIIKKNKPKLAICVYHKPEHFWEIPFLIKSLNPEYKVYFRQHAISRLETVCYAV